ncbi:hypothetical protein OIE66_20420 [Nonomuraea sp. NBC_01738]|uniref:hypothetical protein n=1 Tax=Nonomuraea sp. NBC_01738 TaxID=2976003 RepID=UPI002E106181|nr:hypothetical protein OIE66_20420 [Nonomuraea sp. NBC_01738]
MPVADPTPDARIRLFSWLKEPVRDLAAIAADPRYAPLLAAAVAAHTGRGGPWRS